MERPEDNTGAWDVDAFGNDDACGWSYQLEKSKDLSLLDATLTKLIQTGTNVWNHQNHAKLWQRLAHNIF